MKKLTNFEKPHKNSYPAYYLCRFSPSPFLGQEKSRPTNTCHGRFTEQFSESQLGSGASFKVIGRFLNAATSSLKRATGRILKISVFKEERKNLAFDYRSK
jgi:hypothetical protein